MRSEEWRCAAQFIKRRKFEKSSAYLFPYYCYSYNRVTVHHARFGLWEIVDKQLHRSRAWLHFPLSLKYG